MPKTVLFDLDGTLLDTLTDLTEAVNATLQKMGLPPRTPKQVRAALGSGAAHLLRESLPGHEDRLDEALQIYKTEYPPRENPKTAPFPGIPSLLERLNRDGWRTAVISNKPDHAVQVLKKEFFPSIGVFVGERAGIPRKPAPDSVLAAMASLSADPKQTVYVGDSEVDLATAENAGLPHILVTWGFRDRAELVQAGGKTFAADAEELYRILSSLF